MSRLGGALAILLAGTPLAATADEEPRLALCVDAAGGDAAAAAVLDRWVSTARIELVAPPCPAPESAHFVGQFERRGGVVYFRLAGAAGPTLGRALPWLGTVEAPLASLEAAGRLSEFSVVLEALLAEHHLALEWAEILAAEVKAEPPIRKKSESRRRKAGTGDPARAAAAGASGNTAPAAGGAVDCRDAEAAARPTDVTPPAADPAAPVVNAQDVPVVPAPATGGSGAAVGGAPIADDVPDAGKAGDAPGGGDDPAVTEDAFVAEEPRLPGIEEAARAEAARAAAARAAALARIDFRAPEQDAFPFGLRAGAALRLRAPDILAPELWLGVELGPVYARGAWQPRVRWELTDLTIGVEALGVEAGLHIPLLSGRLWGIRGNAGVLVERLVLAPLYLAEAGEQASWDVGPTLGASVGWSPAPDLVVGLGGAAHWMPTARLTHIGDMGPSARVNAVGARLGIDFSWRR